MNVTQAPTTVPSVGTPSPNSAAALAAELARIRAENAALKAAAAANTNGTTTPPLSIKMTEKGGVSIYGLQRFPVTLYPSQWDRLFEAGPRVTKFIADNRPELDRLEAARKAAKAAKA